MLKLFFDRQAIPSFLVERDAIMDDTSDHNSDQDSKCYTDSKYREGVAMLRAYSLIATNIEGDLFEMHRLVQVAARWLEMQGELENWRAQYVARLCSALPTGDYKNWLRCQILFPHAETMAGQRPLDKDSLKDWTAVLNNVGWFAWAKESYAAT